MVKNRQTTRKLSGHEQWQAKLAIELLDKLKFAKIGCALVATSSMLGDHPCGMIFRV